MRTGSRGFKKWRVVVYKTWLLSFLPTANILPIWMAVDRYRFWRQLLELDGSNIRRAHTCQKVFRACRGHQPEWLLTMLVFFKRCWYLVLLLRSKIELSRRLPKYWERSEGCSVFGEFAFDVTFVLRSLPLQWKCIIESVNPSIICLWVRSWLFCMICLTRRLVPELWTVGFQICCHPLLVYIPGLGGFTATRLGIWLAWCITVTSGMVSVWANYLDLRLCE